MRTAHHPPPFFDFGGNHVAPNRKEYKARSYGPRVLSALSHHTSRPGCGGSQSVQPSGFTASTTEGFTPPRDHTLTVEGHHLVMAAAERGEGGFRGVVGRGRLPISGNQRSSSFVASIRSSRIQDSGHMDGLPSGSRPSVSGEDIQGRPKHRDVTILF